MDSGEHSPRAQILQQGVPDNTARIYLDHNATTPIAVEVYDEMAKVMKKHFGNPSSIYKEGKDAHASSKRLAEKWRNCSIVRRSASYLRVADQNRTTSY